MPLLLLLCQAARLGDQQQLLQALQQPLNAPCSGEDFSTEGTALHEAAGHGHAQLVQLLLDHGADVASKDRFGMTPLAWAAYGGHVKTSQALLASKAPLDATDEFLMTPLGTAAKEGHLEVARLLIEHGADLNARAQLGVTPLMEAAKQGHLELAELLLEHRCDKDATDDLGRPALVDATVRGDLPMVQLLVEHGANVFGQTKQGLPYYLTGTSEVNDYLYQQMKLGALLSRPWVAWVLLVATPLGVLWAMTQLHHRSFLQSDEVPLKHEPPSAPSDALFLQGATVLAKSQGWRWAFAFQILEVSTVFVLIFGLGMGVVWWPVWLPLHLLLYLLPILCRDGARTLLISPEKVFSERAVIKLPRTLFLILLVVVVLAWHSHQCYLAQSLDLAWTAPICRDAVQLPQHLGPLPFDALRNPRLNWYEVLLSPASSWKQPGATVAFGMLVQPYLVTAGFILVLCVAAAVYCGWLLYKTLSAAIFEPPEAQSSQAELVQQLLHTTTLEALPTNLHVETSCSIYGTLVLLALDLIFDLNTVYTLLFTGNPSFAFCLMLVVCRTLGHHMLLGNLCNLQEAAQQSVARGMMRKELMEIVDIHGLEAAASMALTSFSYWFCIQTVTQAAAQITSLLLSVCSFSLFLFHKNIDRESDGNSERSSRPHPRSRSRSPLAAP